ncbi:hypothetical protein EMPS_mp22 (mitochondrion) [Entomortierella parvispora]|uniref:GIY-YIG endonuclease n=1 Tax=Entomortierella parvispora TaxID=205924 RepID=A0A8J9WVM6_9FUNG|nr:hypothetical protein EMPS_mp22 [Entomortierella parvispora]
MLVLIMVYSNGKIDKLRILSNSKGLAEIYLWTHKVSSKKYIGSVVDLSKRLESYYVFSSLK